MATYKNIKVKIGKKPSGKDTRKSRLQRVQVLASGKYKFVKNLTKSSGKSKTTKTKTKKSGSKKMAKRKFTLPMALVSGAALGFVIKPDPTWYSPLEAAQNGDWGTAIKNYATNMIGYRADTGAIFDTQIGMKGLWALIGGFVIHKIATIIGLNRALGRARIPFLRV